jgi:hypothetical protein
MDTWTSARGDDEGPRVNLFQTPGESFDTRSWVEFINARDNGVTVPALRVEWTYDVKIPKIVFEMQKRRKSREIERESITIPG